MAKQQTDDELNIRRKQRRRLVGAVALTLAVVVVLPMLLDDEPKSTQTDIDLHIPDPDKAGEFIPSVEIPESDMAKPAPASQADAIVVPPSDAKPAPPAVPAVVPPAAVKESIPAKPAVNTAPPAAPNNIKTPTSKPVDKPVSASDTGYVAQVGAYANADTAKQELAKLKKWGFKAYTERAGVNMRVRVGPYPSREKAESVGKQLEKRGLQPVILSAK